MEMVTWVERIILAVILIGISHVISNDVDHHPNIIIMACFDKVSEILLGSEIAVKTVHVSGPIAMITSIVVVNNRWDPNGIKSHTLYVVKIFDDSSVTSATVISEIITSVMGTVISGESIG